MIRILSTIGNWLFDVLAAIGFLGAFVFSSLYAGGFFHYLAQQKNANPILTFFFGA